MAGFLNNAVYDFGLTALSGCVNRLYLSSASAGVMADLLSGSSGSVAITAGSPGPGDGGSGRMVVIPAVSSGSIWTSGNSGCWVLTKAATDVMASGSLSASQAVTAGNSFTLTSFNIRIPAP